MSTPPTTEEIFSDIQARMERVRNLQREIDVARQQLVMTANECLCALEALRSALQRASEVQTEVNSDLSRPNDSSDVRPNRLDHAPDSQERTRAIEG